MQNLKIRVNGKSESKEAQELFVKLGAACGVREITSRWVCLYDGQITFYDLLPNVDFKEITLPELRDMVNPMKEYLEKHPDGTYSIVLRGDLCKGDDIEVPEGMNYAYDAGSFIQFTKQEMGYRDSVLIWQREQDELFLTPECTLNDQYAKIEQVCRVEIHGTAKANPDFNFGAAQASVGANPRENNHYFIDVSDVNEVDFYEIAKRYNVTDPAVQHILKKCLAIGNRGHKDLETDLKDILKTAKRALQINGFGN